MKKALLAGIICTALSVSGPLRQAHAQFSCGAFNGTITVTNPPEVIKGEAIYTVKVNFSGPTWCTLSGFFCLNSQDGMTTYDQIFVTSTGPASSLDFNLKLDTTGMCNQKLDLRVEHCVSLIIWGPNPDCSTMCLYSPLNIQKADFSVRVCTGIICCPNECSDDGGNGGGGGSGSG